MDPVHEGEFEYLFPESNFQSTHKQKEIWEKYIETSENYDNFSGGRLVYLAQLLYGHFGQRSTKFK
jgi:hypothetical protein